MGKLNLPFKGGYLSSEDGYEHRGRNEDGPVGIKEKFKSWPGLETNKTKVSAKKSKLSPVKEIKDSKSTTNQGNRSTTTITTKGTK